MRPVRNVIPRVSRDDEDMLTPRPRQKKGPLGVKARLAAAGAGRAGARGDYLKSTNSFSFAF
jgi:hypothetical protein